MENKTPAEEILEEVKEENVQEKSEKEVQKKILNSYKLGKVVLSAVGLRSMADKLEEVYGERGAEIDAVLSEVDLGGKIIQTLGFTNLPKKIVETQPKSEAE